MGVVLPLALPGSPLWHSPGAGRFPAEGSRNAAKTRSKEKRQSGMAAASPAPAGSVGELGH